MEETKLTKEWSPFIPEEGYEKEMQDIMLIGGKEIMLCWPNAGVFVACDGSGLEIPAEEVAFVRLTHDRHW